LISRIDSTGNARYYHFDSRGTTIALTDASGQVTDAYAYDPFGTPTASTGATDNRFRYLGRHGVMDETNGLNYIRARYYSARNGRFVTKDPTTGKDGDSQGLNRYIYALNSPVRLIDISGFSAQEAGNSYLSFRQWLVNSILGGGVKVWDATKCTLYSDALETISFINGLQGFVQTTQHGLNKAEQEGPSRINAIMSGDFEIKTAGDIYWKNLNSTALNLIRNGSDITGGPF
jgi:RHS repeat-associated protein